MYVSSVCKNITLGAKWKDRGSEEGQRFTGTPSNWPVLGVMGDASHDSQDGPASSLRAAVQDCRGPGSKQSSVGLQAAASGITGQEARGPGSVLARLLPGGPGQCLCSTVL